MTAVTMPNPSAARSAGPVLSLLDSTGALLGTEDSALEGAVGLLRRDGIVAIKGLGGFHLAVRASSEVAAAALRSRKHREDKPFAVMVEDTATARRLCELDDVGDSVSWRARAVPSCSWLAGPPAAPQAHWAAPAHPAP